MISEKLGEMVARLKQRTEEGKVDWEETSTRGRFQTTLNDHSLVIAEQENEDDPEVMDYCVTIYNRDGDDIECFTDRDLGEVPEANAEETYRAMMKEIHAMARRKALGAEEAVDAILEVLDQTEEEEGKDPK
ncbi:MAG: hypothetical protein JJ959_12115 [Nisaea sp.]|uniref:hypothetical protein n=1 Tax=Nisaea sp. TaxID=2024842 RepID=UPI001B038C61|nr:hypothetical protein [Nisaea sp.]MBO6561278.1 hypothetical protein [Nisaea sp.]